MLRSPSRPSHVRVARSLITWALAIILAPGAFVPSVDAQSDPEPASASGGDALCIIVIAPTEDFRRVTVTVDLVLSDQDKANYTADVDADEDGTITAAEVAAYESAHAEARPAGDGVRTLVMDALEPTSARLWFDLIGFEGAADPSRELKVAEMREYWFNETRRGDVHRIEGGADSDYVRPVAVIETVVIPAPAGWLVTSVNDTVVMKESVTIQGFDTVGYFDIRYARKDSSTGPSGEPQPIPAVPMPLAAAALVAVAVAFAGSRRTRV